MMSAPLRHDEGVTDGLEHSHGWMVDVATRRVVRRQCLACEHEARELTRLEHEAESSGASALMQALEQVANAVESQRAG